MITTPIFSPSTMVIVFFIYGLSFFVLGFVGFVLSKTEKQFSIEKYIWLLAAFGILHGINEWIDMALLIGQGQWSTSLIEIVKYIRSIVFISSFLFLFSFGFNNLFVNKKKLIRLSNWLLSTIFIVFIITLLINIFIVNNFISLKFADVLSRYFLGFTGSTLTAIAFFKFYRVCKGRTVCHGVMNISSIFMGIFFLLYGITSGLIVPKMGFWPASVFNYDNFLLLTGIPAQVFRTLFAFGTGVCIFGILKVCHTSLIDEIKEEATIDPLTKLKNRRAFSSDISGLLSYAKRYNRPLSMMFFDIDKFKDYNDTYGHQAGDELLRLLANTASKTLREHDLIFRYGGEEFVVLLPETDIAKAKEVAVRLKGVIAKLDLHPNNKTVQKTISIGVIQFQNHWTEKEFIELADQAMYRAKDLGRNRVCVFGEDNCIE